MSNEPEPDDGFVLAVLFVLTAVFFMDLAQLYFAYTFFDR